MIEKVEKPGNTTDGDGERETLVNSETETHDGQSSNTNCDQDSDIFFKNASKKKIGLNKKRSTASSVIRWKKRESNVGSKHTEE